MYIFYLIVRFSDIFTVGRWNGFSQLDPVFNDLVSKLPEYVLASKADSTRKKYGYAFNSFCKWSKLHNISSLPASETYIALYLIEIAENKKSISKIDEAVYAISWAHKLAGYSDPCKSELVVSVREGSHRKIGHTTSRKEPITADILQKLVTKFGKNCNNLKELRIACMCLIGYAGFLRFSELSNIRRSHVSFYATHVKLFIVKSKTDIYREGKEVVISRTQNDTCPVSMLERYLSVAKIKADSDEFIFRSISYCKSSDDYKLRKSGSLSYTRSREILLEALESIGVDKSLFGLHSLRSGGASAAAAAGIDDRIFKKHGRWKSENAKDGYIKEKLDTLDYQ